LTGEAGSQDDPSKLRRKIEEEAEEINFLNIMPMMDMMTILLVFLIKQFSVQQLAVSQPTGLQLPASTAQRQPQPAVKHHHHPDCGRR
jgi:biopolymer transport protein ExbD